MGIESCGRVFEGHVVVVGRMGIKMKRKQQQKQTTTRRSCCSYCRRTLVWVSKYVPREALRIQKNILQIKGKSMRHLVYINDERVQVPQVDDTTNEAWVGFDTP